MNLFQKILLKGTLLLSALTTITLNAQEALPETDMAYQDMAYFDDCDFCYYPQNRFPIAGDFTLGYENFRSLPEGSWEGNTGSYASLNLGAPIPYLSCYGLGIQIGGSYGVYHWSGRGSPLNGNPKEVQQQGFLTVGIFRRALCGNGFNYAIAYDWMFNKNFGVFALNPNFDQVRYLASWLFCCRNEVGCWGTVHTKTSHKTTVGLPVSFRAINQINLFWRHYYANCAETTIWAGVPYGNSLMFHRRRPGEFIVGASFKVPLTQCLSIDGHAVYMQAHHQHGIFESRNYASDVAIGINYSFGGPRCCCDPCDYRPYLPVANNSNFLADTSLNY